MKLLDLLVEEGVEWPEGAKFVAQCSDKSLHFFEDKPKFLGNFGVWFSWTGFLLRDYSENLLKDLAEDYEDKVVTKEEYLETKVKLNKNYEEGVGIENVGSLLSKYKEQINLSNGLKKLSLEYRHDARETLKKVNSLLEESGLEVSGIEDNKTSLW